MILPIPSWSLYVAGVGAVALTVALGYSRFEVAGLERLVAEVRQALSTEQADRARDVGRAAEVARAQESAHRATEQRWQDQQQEVARAAELSIAKARADAAAATAAAGRLRGALAAARAGSSFAAANPGSAISCQAAGETGVVLADMLGRVVDRAGELAAAADASRIAGEACERAYSSLTATSEAAQ